MITLKQLHYALAVDKTKHFKKAAEACSVSQSALSSAISELESQLGIQLFERDNKSVMTTPIGQLVLEKAQSIRMQVDELALLAQSEKQPLSYPISMGVIPTIAPFLLPVVLPALREQYPQLRLTIIEEQSHVLVDMVRRGELDTAVLALPYALDGLHAFEFWQEDFYLICHHDLPYAEADELRSDQLDPGSLLLLKDGHCLKDHALAACKLQPSTSSEALAGTSLGTLIHMVEGKMGSTLVPHMALPQILKEHSALRAVHLNEPGPHRKIAFITRLNYAGVNNIQLLMKLFRAQLDEHLGVIRAKV
ncbi:hydrogen peroxide-inducible genes activator [Teredinibacter sp. KSP-S5-2]|uniref:hydrogen peroxide-inducible genes activator n=1 Tax=Teredinibacter sp. KSP-S5-2 TaxID=3034506 RepID=UPI002934ADD3|nr:hydrogen peroxide-inducible genes activator [Teredinibacter sp. KSP-S5-2]WNO08767.1 hydrogen peroxide-inducible genes activator [Teredinibacter sp. KSP-S5-2]